MLLTNQFALRETPEVPKTGLSTDFKSCPTDLIEVCTLQHPERPEGVFHARSLQKHLVVGLVSLRSMLPATLSAKHSVIFCAPDQGIVSAKQRQGKLLSMAEFTHAAAMSDKHPANSKGKA